MNNHLYERLSNPYAVKSILNIIRTDSIEVVNDLFNNLTKLASEHPRYNDIKNVYNERINSKK